MTDKSFTKPNLFGTFKKTATVAGNEAYPKDAAPIEDEKENYVQDFSDEELDQEFEKEEARKKQEILKQLEQKQNVRTYEDQKAKGLIKAMDDPDRGGEGSKFAASQFLDDLWFKVRNFLNDVNDKGERKELGPLDDGKRTQFVNACKYKDTMRRGFLSEQQMLEVFSQLRLQPLPSRDELRMLYKALEVFTGAESSGDVLYDKILSATVKREHTSLNGIFPKIKAKGPSQKQIEEQKRKEDEERKKKEKADEEERKRRELVDKRLQEQKKNEGYKRPNKEDQKMKEREEELKREAERKEQERKQKEETDAVRKEVTEYKKSIAQIQKVILDSRENLRNWFKLFDDNNDDFMEFEEFKRLLLHVKVVVKDNDLKNLFQIMDLQQSGRISYNNFCDVIERSQTLPIDAIVRKRRIERGENYLEQDTRVEGSLRLDNVSQPFKSALGEAGGSQRKELGSVDGMSDILRRSEGDFEGRQLIQEDDTILIYNDMKEQLRQHFSTFDDLLQKMGRPNTVATTNAASKVLFKDFETLIRGMPTGYKYSTQQLRNVFKLYAQHPPTAFTNDVGEDYIATMEFKDKFFPGVFYQRQTAPFNLTSGAPSQSSFGMDQSLRSSTLESKSESMHVDNILAGKRYEDVQADKQVHQEARIREKELKYLAQGSKAGLGVINEDRFEAQSQSSIPSRAIDDMMGSSVDPRRNKNAASKGTTLNNSLQNTSNAKGLKQTELLKFQSNPDFYRQQEAVMKQLPIEERFRFDKSLDGFFKQFCLGLINEVTNSPVKRDVASFVLHYGKEKPGFINYSEFKKIYEIHIQQVENQQASPQQEEAILSALFKIFDRQSLGRVPLSDFVQTILSQQTQSTVVERLKNKVKKGGERLINVLSEEFQQADIPYGCKGELPISNFQTIMIDYDLPLMESDLQDLRKKAMTLKDNQGNEFVRYKEILGLAKPRKVVAQDAAELNRLVAKIQALWRGYQQRKRFNKNTFKDFTQVGTQFKRVGKGVQFKDQDETEKGRKASPKKMTPQQKKEELEKKKKQMVATNKAKRKKGETLEARMGSVVKKNQDKLSEKQLQVKQEITDYIKNDFLNDLIEKAQCYAESLILGRDIQRKFETRPVTRFVFPMIQEFQYNVMGVQPKTLQTLNELGQIMYLDSENQLNQYDIPTNKTLQQVNLGTRPPLKHYDIIDLVCDQTSGRIYTLNSNWILEIWNIEQNVSLPQKRLAVCTNEGNKDFISLYYKSTFNNAKPRFLSLSDHNQQILVVNTSCVDGSIVFIDPISFSVLKKIQLKYQDYEIPKRVRETITFLKQIFKNIIEKSGKTIFDIFEKITNKETQSCKLRDFAIQLSFFDQTQKLEDIFKMCQELDEDGSGTITLDEFLHYFQHLDSSSETDFERKKAEEELYENAWPEWVVRENKLEQAKGVIVKMFDCLRKTPNISPEQAFQIFDQKEKGLVSIENFKKILTMFFSDAKLDTQEVEFVLRLTQKTVDQQYMYREFCKFLDKRFVRTFKGSTSNNELTSQNASFSATFDLKDSYLKELDRRLVKEASLSYVIRKSAELNLDLRAIFLKNDENSLSVIPRARFLRILESLPLGLLSFELEEIFDNDLNYDNYGNVDYTVILNSDIFVTLERQRLRKLTRKATTDLLDSTHNQSAADVDKLTDNRKVVVEDLIYIDDLEVLIYTTVAPKTSTIFVTNAKKLSSDNSEAAQVEVVNLSGVQSKLQEQSVAAQSKDLMTNYYQLLAKLKGHKNTDPPTLHYVAQSGCLISGEKFLAESAYRPGRDTMPKADDPSIPVSHKFQKSSQGAYETHADRQHSSQYKAEIMVWNIQKHMIELFQTNPPWRVPVSRRFSAHNASIIDICYLQKAQLLVSTSTDQTIRFFDPISTSYELTDPNNIPHAQQRPGYYKPMLKELTRSNTTFKEVRRIYTSADTACYSLRCLNIQSITLDSTQPDFKSQIEWLVGLRLGRPQWQGRKNTQVGFVCGYGIERVKIEVPAVHHDDLPPPTILKECEELIAVRRRRLVTAFQHNLPHRIERIYSQVQLQNSYMAQIRKLFLEAILKRKELKYVNPEPLREIYKIILKLPNRNKFENFLAISGCSDKLSVSETFFYLQKFMQIHPLRTTQIEFEKSIEEFQKKHSREFLRGTKRWNKAAVQKFANYVKAHGLNIAYLERDSFQASSSYTQAGKVKVNDFCTRERFIQYFNEIVFHEQRFSDEEVDTVLNELDPFFTGVIQISLIQNYYREEIHFHNLTTLNRPKQIFADIRGKVFPNKKLALQQALVSVDSMGDGYIHKEQFIEAFQKAEIKEDRDVLEFLFDVVAEKFDTHQQQSADTSTASEVKVLSITYFIKKLFSSVETAELSEVDQTLQNVKAALIYKGLDFSVVFAENSVDTVKQKRPPSTLDKSSLDDSMALQKKLKETQIDLTQHYTRFAQQLVSAEFCQRIEQLQARAVTAENIRRLANFLALNQKNQSVVYLNAWLHHLRRVQTAFHQPNKAILPVICSKLLRNENVFRSYVDSTADLKGKREEEKLVDVADLRSVLLRFGVNYINQDFFITEFTRSERVHIEDLVTRMKSCVQQAYNLATSTLNRSLDQSNSDNSRQEDLETLKDLRKTDYFDRVQMKLKTLQGKHLLSDFVEKFKAFDPTLMGRIKIHHFINVLKYNYAEVFDSETLVGLQFELECLNSDDCVDYEEFVKIFLERKGERMAPGVDYFGDAMPEFGLGKKQQYQVKDYEDLLSRLNAFLKQNGYDDLNAVMRIFKIFAKNNSGEISYEHLKKVFDMLGFVMTDTEFKLMINFADENRDGAIQFQEFANQIVYAKELASQFDIKKWIVASRALLGRYYLLDRIKGNQEMLKDMLIQDFGADGTHSGVLTGEQFQDLLRDSKLEFNEYEVDLMTVYAIKGSRRTQPGQGSDQQVSIKSDLIQYYSLVKSLEPIVQHMRKEDDQEKRKQEDEDMFEDEVSKFRKDLQRKEQESLALQHSKMDSNQLQREQGLVNKIIEIFVEREVTFFDCFQQHYDPLNPRGSTVTVSQFKKAINTLNLPLTVQELRVLRRIADPQQIGKVDLQRFCARFENAQLRRRRLNHILEKIATAFYLQNFNLRRAFALFDKNGDGSISRREFREGWLTLNLGLTYDEIDELMSIVDTDRDGAVSYDEFISKMDVHIQKKSKYAAEQAKEVIFHKIRSLIEVNTESLYEIFSNYDYSHSGAILVQDLLRGFKRLGVLHPEPHMKLLLEAGGARETDERVDYVVYSQNLQGHIEKILGLSVKKNFEIMQKVNALISAKRMSPFEFFVNLDVNNSGKLSKIEFKTGLQAMGINIGQQDFLNLWKLIKKPVNKFAALQQKEKESQRSSRREQESARGGQEVDAENENLSYYELLQGFITSGCFKFQKSVDNTNNLVNKYRQQLKKLSISVEKAYKQYDPEDHKFVFKHDFVSESLMMGLEFNEEELEKIFEFICQVGTKGTDSNDQQKQLIDRKQQKSTTRFAFKQLHDAVLVKRDENWIFQSFIKIHGVVLQKNLSYKRLFAQWREKGSKTAAGRLSQKELRAGLKKLRAGLTQDEIEKLTSSVPFEGKDNSIAAADFERLVVQGAKKLEQEKSYQKLVIQEWITTFNNALEKQQMPVERVFAEHDGEQAGSLSFEEFAMLNDYVGMGMNKKELKRVFDIVDRTKSGRVRLEEVKSISSLVDHDGEQDDQEEESKLKGEELKSRQDLDDLYEQLKDKLEKKNVTLEGVIFDGLKYMPTQFANVKGVQQVFEKLGITLSAKETEKVLGDVRTANNGRYECSFKEFVDFMTRKRINVAFFDKGFVDPLIAQCCQQIHKTAAFYELSVEKVFQVFDKDRDGKIGKEALIKCIQGMGLGISIEDLIEFFNYLDDKNENSITKLQFVDGVSFVVSKIGGGSQLENALSQGVQQTKKGASIKQQVLAALKKISDAIQSKRFSMRQVLALFDKERTGFISRSEFALTLKSIEGGVSLDEARMLMNFFDDKNTGKLSVVEFAKALQEIMNSQTGGGIYAFSQVQPILQRIINELAVDCDKFFDEVADLNEALVADQMRQQEDSRPQKQTRAAVVGLNKALFYAHLQRYGVQLDDDEKTLLNTVFAIPESMDKFDYEKLDAAFEGVQQQLYQHETFYTVEWQRRIFKKIGEYLRKNNLTIHKCFNLIDEDNSQSISIAELKNAILRFQLDISDRELEVFMKRIAGDDRKNSVTQQQFIKMFWSAYTYEDVFSDQLKSKAADPSRPLGARVEGLGDRIKQVRMFGAIQQKIKSQANASAAFKLLDKGVGFLTLKDFQNYLPQNFAITLKQDEVLRLFKEVDRDRDGLVKYKEFEQFYNEDYHQRLQLIEKERLAVNYQYEIFDHLMKVLGQKSLTLAEVFDQIDTNQNGYIECDEFQNLLERLGFTISEAQVYELMRQIDENFDGKISYKELRDHIRGLGFSVGLDNQSLSQSTIALKGKRRVEPHVWRDKGVELVIRTLKAHLNKKPFEEYFRKFDGDHDNHLTPAEFRLSLTSLKDAQLKKFQVERIMHILLDEKKSAPVVSISKAAKFLRTYQYIDKDSVQKGNNTTAVLIDEDLFVYIVEKYDGFSRLVDIISQLEEKASYVQRHVFEINLRGLNMLANQKTVEKLHKKASKLNELFESSLVLLAGEAGRLIKEEAQLCVLDPSHNINTITNDQNAGVLASIHVPTIENSAFDIDFATLNYLPSGAQRYMGVMSDSTRRKVEVLIFPNDDLNYVSSDGKTYKKHLSLEMQVHRFLMGQHLNGGEEGEELSPELMDIFPNVGKFEKKIGLAASDKEIYVVNEMVDYDQWISLQEFVDRNGGILNIPLFYHTDAPLFIIRYWAQKLLQILNKLHEVSIVGRNLNLAQIFISRDGQRMKLGHLRGVGKVNNLGFVKECPDIYLTLENNSLDERYNGGQSSTVSPGGHGGAASSSKRTEAQKSFSNRALDNPFIAPEILFSKFTEHTSALDVWSFGMIMYCVLLGQQPESFYSIYRAWYKTKHGYDIELAQLPFVPPSQSNFIYDPFSIDFDNPFNKEEFELNQDLHIDLPGSLIEKRSHLNFANVMKCIKNLSNSSLFEDGNSKKFQFKSVAQDIRENNNPNVLSDQPPRFAGQSHTNQEVRRKMFSMFAKAEVLERKNELGLVLDLISSCLDMDPKRRPTINGLLNSPLFQLDNYETTNAVRFSQNVILYRSPQSSVSLRITAPLRAMCAIAIKNPFNLFSMEADILKLFLQTEECIAHISSLPIDQINSVLTENEKRKSLLSSTIQSQFKGKDFSQLRVSPNSPLAAQIVEDKVIDMLIFLTFRYTKTFDEWKSKRLTEIGKEKQQSILKIQQEKTLSQSSRRKSVKFENDALTATDGQSVYQNLNQSNLQKKQTERLQNLIIQRMTNLLRTLIYEMHSYSTPLAPFVREVLEYVVKFYTGEEYKLGSDYVLRKTSGMDSTLKDYLRGRSFFRREGELAESFKSDNTDKQWHLEQKNKTFLDKSNHWNTNLHKEALKIYKDAVTESGMGQSCYPVINDFISNVSNSFEPSKVFSSQMNHLCLSFLIPMNRTAFYYNELIPLTECLARLYSPELEKAGKRCALAVVRSVFQTGSSDKIKACLDMRVPKHIIHFLQDNDSEVRHECLLIFYEISKGLQDDDFEILGKSAANLKQELSKRAHRRTAFDSHKTLSLVSQQEDVAMKSKEDEESKGKKKRGQAQQSQADMMANYIKRTTALIEKNDNEKFINFALDLPNLNFLSNKRFLREMAICFESPVFIAPLIRLLKSPVESYQNKETILQIIFNLFCGNEKVLIALNSPACDTYMTLLKMLMQNSKIQSAKISASGLSAQMRQQLVLQEKVVELFRYMFEQRRPTIIRDLSCIGASSTLLKEQGLFIPALINLPEIVAFVDEFSQVEDLRADMIIVDDFLSVLKDLRCWVKHFYAESQIPELTRIKALQRCINLIIKVIRILWDDFPHQADKRADYLILIKAGLQLIDWLCVRGQEHFIFNEQSGKYNLEFIIEKCNYALSAFRRPGEVTRMPMEELAHNSKNNKEVQKTRKYDMFPFTEIGAILQNVLYQLVRKNAPLTNQLLSEADFGFVFGEQLILEYDFIRHCIDNKIESMVLIDTYFKKNEIRLNSLESLLCSSEHTLKSQFVKSNFIDKLFGDYLQDFREFNIQFSKIDLEFLAFRKTFPIRLEGISIINTALRQKQRAPSVFTEVIMYARRHFLIRNEVTLLRQGRVSTEESTALLLFSIILESNEEDLIYAMMQEGAHKVIRDMMKEYPSLNKKFPILAQFTNKF